MPITQKLREFLDQSGVHYRVHGHREVYTAQEVAQVEHVPGKDLAKVVMLRSGSDFFMAVLPAPYHVDLVRAKTAPYIGRLPHFEERTCPARQWPLVVVASRYE